MAETTTGQRLVALADLDERQVTVVRDTPHGTLAVGISEGEPFAVSNRCRHLLASLGDGVVNRAGCLVCPSHHARFDVRSGRMVAGPGGAFTPVGGVIKETAGRIPLKRYAVEIRDEAIWLTGG